MDHPEFFRDFRQFLGAFEKFTKKMVGPKILIVNWDSLGVKKFLGKMKEFLRENKYQVIGYSLVGDFSFPFVKTYWGRVVHLGEDFSEFLVGRERFRLKIPGVHNIANALGVVACARFLGIDWRKIKKALFSFSGINRRFEMVGQEKGVLVFDDYAVHPTAIEATIKAARQKFPKSRIWAIFEPHQFSRLKLFLKEFAKALSLGDKIVITKVYEGREKPQKGVNGSLLVKVINSPDAFFIEDFDKVSFFVKNQAKRGDLVLVFGAGKSYLISRKILEALKK